MAKYWRWAGLAAIIIFVAAVRIRLLGFPLERDEGEYAYIGQLILQGVAPYKLAYSIKYPGMYIIYAAIMACFGQTAQGIHFGLLLVNAATIVLVFLVTEKLAGHRAAVIAGWIYGLLSLSYSVLGFAGHATHFVAFFMLAGFFLLIKAAEGGRWAAFLFSGSLFGTAFLIKQSAVFFFIFGISAILFYIRHSGTPRVKRAVLHVSAFTAGFLLPVILTFALIYLSGAFDKFRFWTLIYLHRYVLGISLREGIDVFKNAIVRVTDGYILIWVFSILALAALAFDRRKEAERPVILSFAFFSFLAVCPGLYFREQYFITLLPAVSVLAAVFLDRLGSTAKRRYLALALFALAAAVGIVKQKEYLFFEKPAKLCREIYGLNPFPESAKIAEFVRSKTGPDDTVAIAGSEPQIYFYSNRRSATGYIYMYGLMEAHPYRLQMQKEMAREIESKRPKILVYVAVPESWLVKKDSERYIFEWVKRYASKNYKLIGVVDIFSDATIYKWGAEAEQYKPEPPYQIYIYERV